MTIKNSFGCQRRNSDTEGGIRFLSLKQQRGRYIRKWLSLFAFALFSAAFFFSGYDSVKLIYGTMIKHSAHDPTVKIAYHFGVLSVFDV